jgi:hypothetical protein
VKSLSTLIDQLQKNTEDQLRIRTQLNEATARIRQVEGEKHRLEAELQNTRDEHTEMTGKFQAIQALLGPPMPAPSAPTAAPALSASRIAMRTQSRTTTPSVAPKREMSLEDLYGVTPEPRYSGSSSNATAAITSAMLSNVARVISEEYSLPPSPRPSKRAKVEPIADEDG